MEDRFEDDPRPVAWLRQTPERRLYQAMLADALNLLYTVSPRDPYERRRLRNEALLWFQGKVESAPCCSFEEICTNLELGDHRPLVREIMVMVGAPPDSWGFRPSRPSGVFAVHFGDEDDDA